MTQGRCKRLLGGTPGVGLVNISVHLACISLYCCSFFAYSGLGKERKVMILVIELRPVVSTFFENE